MIQALALPQRIGELAIFSIGCDELDKYRIARQAQKTYVRCLNGVVNDLGAHIVTEHGLILVPGNANIRDQYSNVMQAEVKGEIGQFRQ